MEINLTKLNQTSLSFDQYIILQSIYSRDRISFNQLKTYYQDNMPEILADLVKEKYIFESDNEYFAMAKTSDIFNETDIDFNEFWTIYPRLVPGRYGGKRPLRTLGNQSKMFKDCKNKYLSKVKKLSLHNRIIKIVKLEIASKKRNDELRYMPSIEVYINQQNWEKYEYLLEEDNKEEDDMNDMI